MIYVGIDPGNSGAVVALSGDGMPCYAWDMPTWRVRRSKRGKVVEVLDEQELRRIVRALAMDGAHVYLEQASSMPGQGRASIFNYGTGFGIVRGMLAFAGVPYQLVHPRTWKGAMGCTADKEVSLERCLAEFPGHDHLWFGEKMGTLDGRCEAALLALYGLRLG